eukprot:scaffold1319_cov126-Cylindrotheca_fusiformis.AAC.5
MAAAMADECCLGGTAVASILEAVVVVLVVAFAVVVKGKQQDCNAPIKRATNYDETILPTAMV